jgi:hypothetical protein
MGKRFLNERYSLEKYSNRRANLRLNEEDFEPHQIRPYGLESSSFSYRQMFQKKHQTRLENRSVKRSVKKSARQQAKQQMREENYEF